MAISTKSDQDTERRPSGRLSRADRRAQLLRTATALIEELGADALTLGVLAERADHAQQPQIKVKRLKKAAL